MQNIDKRIIGICIPTYNRYALTIKSFEQVLNDDRIEEITIVDDASTDGSFELLRIYAQTQTTKVRLFRNKENLDCYFNKNKAVVKAKQQWVILLDSDNVITKEYIDTLFAIENWDKDTIYQPSFAKPHFDFREFDGLELTIKNVNNYMGTNICTALNAMNFFINRNNYIDVWDGSTDPMSSDSIYFNYCWLRSGRKILITPNLWYNHLVHDAHFVQNQHRTKKFYEQLLNAYKSLNVKLIFDIGANEGNTADLYSKIAEKVIAFEPNPNLHKRLESRFKDTNVVIDKRAVDNKTGESIFSICDANSLSTFSESWIKNGRFSERNYWDIKIPVSVVTLQDAIAEYGVPDYIKIDVEGYEYEVLQGLKMLLPNTTICFEWAEEQFEYITKSIRLILDLGYNAFSYTIGDDVKFNYEIGWTTWDDLDFTEQIEIGRKENWGMIYFKKEKNSLDKDFYKKTDKISIDKIHSAYCNLDIRQDRNEKMISELNRVGISMERLSSFYWKDLYNHYTDEEKKKVQVMYKRTPGAIGCHYSQVAIMEEAIKRNKHAWVNEDDLIFCDDIQERLDIIFDFLNTHEWDIFWMGGTYHKEPTWHKIENGKHTHPDLQMCECTLNRDWEETDNNYIVRTFGAFSTHSYIVNKNSIERVMRILEGNVHRSMGIDWIFLLEQPNLMTYAFSYGCVKQYNSQSNISNGYANQEAFKNLGEHFFSKSKDTYIP